MKFLVIYGSVTGKTEKMAGYIAEGMRFAGAEAEVKPFTEVKQPEDFAGYDEVYREFFQSDPPARATVQAHLLGGVLVEIQAIAVLE